MMTDTLINFIQEVMNQENSIRLGFNNENKKWYPHKSLEGGTDTIAYGHKLSKTDDFSLGITELEAIQLLTGDLVKAESYTEFDWNKYSNTKFDSLPQKYQYVLIDLVFNSGTLYKNGRFGWPKLAQAIVDNDDQQVYEQSIRSYFNPNTNQRIRLEGRSNAICKSVGLRFIRKQ